MAFLEGESIKLLQGDCLEVMKSIPDGSVDAVIADVPYGTTSCKWDSVIDFDLMWAELKRVIKPNGAIALFGSEPFSSALRMSNIKQFKYDWVWLKSRTVGFLNAKNAPLKKYEHIHIFSEGATANGSKRNMPYNPQGLIGINEVRDSVSQGADTVVGSRPSRQNKYISKHKGFPNNVLEYKNEPSQQHPTQKPVALLEYLIKTYTSEGETVLDFTMGSGSTGVAAKNLNRRFIGIELDPNYFAIAKNRIENT